MKKIKIFFLIYKWIKLFIEEEDNDSFSETNIGVNNQNGNYIPPHFRWYLMNRLARDFSNYLNTMENFNTTDKSFFLLIFGAISLLTFSYMYIKSSEDKDKGNNTNKEKNEDDINNNIDDLE